MRLLSGGNQQRVVLARELSASPTVLVAAQPTHGLDVGAIEYMGARLRAAAESGVGVLLISTELEEMLALAHRIVRHAPRADRRRDAPSRGRPRAPRAADGRGRGVREMEELPLAVVDAAPVIPGGAPRAAGAPDAVVTVATYVVSIAVALALCALLRRRDRRVWEKVFSALLDGSVRSPGAWGLTLTTAAPLLIVAVGTIIATKAGLVNIGQEGQLLIGASCCAYVAVRIPGPGWFACSPRWPPGSSAARCGPGWPPGCASGARCRRSSRRCSSSSWPSSSSPTG